MNKDKLTEAMGYIDPALIEEADIQTAAAPRRRWKRLALVAACLCLALAGTALAAEMAGIHVSDFVEGSFTDLNGAEQESISYEYALTGIQFIPADTLSPKVSEHIAKTRGSDGSYYIGLAVASMQKAENFLGLDLPDNPVLDQAKHGWKGFYKGDQYGDNAHRSRGFCEICLQGYNETPEVIRLSLVYVFPGSEENHPVSVNVSMNLFTDQCDSSIEEDGVQVEVHMMQNAGRTLNALDKFTYTAPSGLEATIIETSNRYRAWEEDVTYYRYTAFFALDNVFLNVTIDYPDEALARETLEQVLDGFVYEAPDQP